MTSTEKQGEVYVLPGCWGYVWATTLAVLGWGLFSWVNPQWGLRRSLSGAALIVAAGFLAWLVGPATVADGRRREVLRSPGLLRWLPRRSRPVEGFESAVLCERYFWGMRFWTVSLRGPAGEELPLQRYFTESAAHSALDGVAAALGLPRLEETRAGSLSRPAPEAASPLLHRLSAHPQEAEEPAREAAGAPPPGTVVSVERELDETVVRLKPAGSRWRTVLAVTPAVVLSLAALVLGLLLWRDPFSERVARMLFYVGRIWLPLAGVWLVVVGGRGEWEVTIGPRRTTLKSRVWFVPVFGAVVPTGDIREVVVEPSGAVRLRTSRRVIRFGKLLNEAEKRWLAAAVVAALAIEARALSA